MKYQILLVLRSNSNVISQVFEFEDRNSAELAYSKLNPNGFEAQGYLSNHTEVLLKLY
jgi:hypothetical protein